MSSPAPKGGYRGGRGGYRGGRGGGDHPGNRGGFSGGQGGGRGGGRGDSRGGGEARGRGRGGRGRGRPHAEPQVFSPPVAPTLDLGTKTIEDKYNSKVREPGLEALSLDRQFPLRPGYGTRGRHVLLWANYFQLVAKQNTAFYRYNIEIKAPGKCPEPKGKKVKRIIQLLLEDHLQEFRGRIATDFKATLVCRDSLQFESQVFDVAYRADNEDTPPADPDVYQVRVLATGSIGVADILNYLSSANLSERYDRKEEILQVLNIVVGYSPKTKGNILTVGANRHFQLGPSAEKSNLQGGLEALRGYFVSVRAATARLLVNVQVKHIACLNEGPLKMVITAIGGNDKRLQTFLKGKRVQLLHLQKVKGNQRIPRVKTITGFANTGDGRGLEHPPRVAHFAAGPDKVYFYLKGPLKEGQSQSEGKGGKKGKRGKGKEKDKAGAAPDHGYISVYEYFSRVHNVSVMDLKMPVVNVGSKQNPSYLPGEVCYVEEGQPSNTKLTPTQSRAMIKFAVRPPYENAKSITGRGTQVIGVTPNTPQVLTNMGLSISPHLIAVDGRVLEGPVIRYGESSKYAKGASWNLTGVKFPQASTLSQWTYLYLPGATDQDISEKIREFIETAGNHGLKVSNPLPPVWFGERFYDKDNSETLADKVDRAFNALLERHPYVKFVLVILPLEDSSIYNRVKYRGDIQNGIHTVCVLANKFRGIQYCANVALKFNLKLGGTNHVLDSSKLGVVGEGKTMLVGIDVTHPSPGSSSQAPSVAAMVANVDKHLAQWPASIRLQQEPKAEMVDKLQEMLESRLRLWQRRNNKTLPENLLVYRDGVSEGQYNRVLEEELPLLRKACERLYPATWTKKNLPRISIIVVGKRHNTRFYPVTLNEADANSNPVNGTIVDRGVTEARNWDFYLQAHTALHGTAKPAHYFVILDEIFRARKTGPATSDALEDLTHNLCYLFGRATKAVSVCPPAYYADLACERARRYLSSYFDASPSETVVSGQTGQGPSEDELRIHPNLENSMFYI
ncbi:Piwi domain containing protein [Coccidioides posadasii C735 delta SOWgp]|uniref:Piwi domain containing protein n=1 Tax=Coccidioides posadasii (strain C735) TaxID=222929 RepID=C5PJP0_COCP7|nr:Piwi domain containing protein [Coccidioides posadasii C735 delta SOWgp]EER22939.1 Piwi domain containing protein [Coccidioides posadasii C735 delta SOWgp]|eukprot:XP_003065084.1 Piwi domain containing protein [Coccidioides posadasii C735 delta SOWgp]